jgi:redox-sensitive bicupin YhaK (pirin superfamily)
MSTTTSEITLLPKARQQNITGMGGVLVANKPVIGGRLADGRPSSSLFYWSHSHFTDDFEFGLHDHQGFEIITVVLDGANSHYDTATRKWADLVTDDVQIIQSGAGVSHNERITKGTHAFQIWFDPDFQAALRMPATYVDHAAGQFTWQQFDGFAVKDIVGGAGPVVASTPGMAMRRVTVTANAVATIGASTSDLLFCYIISGSGLVSQTPAGRDDLVSVAQANELSIESGPDGADIFIISVPQSTAYTPVRGR